MRVVAPTSKHHMPARALSSAMSSRHDEYPPTDVGGNRSGSAQAGYRARARVWQAKSRVSRVAFAKHPKTPTGSANAPTTPSTSLGRSIRVVAGDAASTSPQMDMLLQRGLLKTSQTTRGIAAFSLHERDTMQGAAIRVPDYQFETFGAQQAPKKSSALFS